MLEVAVAGGLRGELAATLTVGDYHGAMTRCVVNGGDQVTGRGGLGDYQQDVGLRRHRVDPFDVSNAQLLSVLLDLPLGWAMVRLAAGRPNCRTNVEISFWAVGLP